MSSHQRTFFLIFVRERTEIITSRSLSRRRINDVKNYTKGVRVTAGQFKHLNYSILIWNRKTSGSLDAQTELKIF